MKRYSVLILAVLAFATAAVLGNFWKSQDASDGGGGNRYPPGAYRSVDLYPGTKFEKPKRTYTNTCGPYGIAVALAYMGKNISYDAVYQELKASHEMGTAATSLIEYLDGVVGARGHNHGTVADIQAQIDVGKPAILVVDAGKSPHYIVVVGYLCVVVVLVASRREEKPTTTPVAPDRPIPAAILSRAMNAVVQIKDRDTGVSGTGYVFQKYGNNVYSVVTCSHVISFRNLGNPDPTRFYAVCSPSVSNSTLLFESLVHDPVRDIAILYTVPVHGELPVLGSFDIEGFELKRSMSPPVFVAGFPAGKHSVLPTKTVEQNWQKLLGEEQWVLHDSIKPGGSGSPVVTYNGSVVGMAQAVTPVRNRTVCLGLLGIYGFLMEVNEGKHRPYFAKSDDPVHDNGRAR